MFFLLDGILKQAAESKNVRSKISHQPQIPPLKQNKQLIKNKPSKKNMSHPTSIPPPKKNTCPFYMFSDSCSQLMSTTSADFICLKTWAPNHTNVISKPWHTSGFCLTCVCVCLLFRSESGCNRKLLDFNVPTCDTYSLFLRFVKVYPLKLTSQWKTTISNRIYIFKWWSSHCYVSLQECRKYQVDL